MQSVKKVSIEEDLRSFVAVDFPESIKHRLGEVTSQFKDSLNSSRTRVTWVKSESHHLTLKFLGSIKADIVASILKGLEKAVTGIQPFLITLGETGVFPNPNQPKIIWIGVTQGVNELIRLQKVVESALEKLGFKPEKRGFSPHLTLGRIKAVGSRGEILRALKTLQDVQIGEVKVEKVKLMKSILTPHGAHYSALGTLDLKKE